MSLFSSIKILDLSRVFSGPFATKHFAEYGATVTKIESPQGDESRQFPPLIQDWSGYFELLNHNKESLTLDLKTEEDLQRFYTLCKDADVIVENFTPQVKQRLKIDYTTIKQINSKIIYASLSGVSELIDRKYYDVIAQAESGFISLNGQDTDMKVAPSVVDAFTGMKLAYAISSALFQRATTGKGVHITVSMKGCAFDLLEQNLIEASICNKNPVKVGNHDSAIAPFGIFKTADGSIALAIGNEALWKKLESFLASNCSNYQSELFKNNQQRLEKTDLLTTCIEEAFSHFTSNELFNILSIKGVPCGQVKTMLDVLADQENYDLGLLQKIDLPVGQVIVPVGGIFFSDQKPVKYMPAPKQRV